MTSRATSAGGGLVFSSDADPGIARRRSGRGFRYVGPTGRPVRDPAVLERIRALAIPPAWTDVWICRDPRGHLQAVGRDARGRKQPRYHATWRARRDDEKFARLAAFGQALPAIRRRVDRDLRRPDLSRERVLATVVRLLEITYLRIGNEEYARTNRSFGLTTLRSRHVIGELDRPAVPLPRQGRQDAHRRRAGPAPRPGRRPLPGPARPGAVPVPR